jgi:MarR family transcriptional regulator, lower aerobic nicotinate degradation pathway regulator
MRRTASGSKSRSSRVLPVNGAARVFEYFNEALAPLGIRRKHLHVLILVGEYQPVQQVELGRLLVLSPATITHVVNDLEELGALERRRDPGDKRAHHLHLTERGTAMIREAETISRQATERVFAVLNPAERKALHRMLIRLARREPAGVPG